MRSSLPVLLGKDAKIERFPVRKSCSREKALCAAVQLSANTLERPEVQSIQSHKRLIEEIKGVSHRSLQSNPRVSQKLKGVCFLSHLSKPPKMREGFSRKDMLKSLLSNGVNSHDIHRRPMGLLRTLYQQKHCQIGLKENMK